MKNRAVHEAFEKSNVKKWEVAEKLGIADTTFSKKLRKELPESEKQKILKIIEGFASEQRGAVVNG